MAIRKQTVKRQTVEIGGIPCTIAQIVSKPGREGATITIHAIRGVHTVQSVLDVLRLAGRQANAVNTEWTDPIDDRSEVGKDHREGTIHGFRWVADWSTGCKVYLVTGPEYRHHQDVVTAVGDLRKYFEQRLKTVPDLLEVIRHTDSRANQSESEE